MHKVVLNAELTSLLSVILSTPAGNLPNGSESPSPKISESFEVFKKLNMTSLFEHSSRRIFHATVLYCERLAVAVAIHVRYCFVSTGFLQSSYDTS